MARDKKVLHAFERKLTLNLYMLGSKSQQPLLVAIKYDGTVHDLHSGNRDIVKDWKPQYQLQSVLLLEKVFRHI